MSCSFCASFSHASIGFTELNRYEIGFTELKRYEMGKNNLTDDKTEKLLFFCKERGTGTKKKPSNLEFIIANLGR